MNVRRRNSMQKSLRDYLVPIVGLVLILILIFSVFSGDDSTPNGNLEQENRVGISVSLDSSSTEAYVIYPGENKETISGDISLYKGEKVMVKEGTLSLSMLGLGDYKLNKLGEFKYLENGDFSLYSSDLWLNSISEQTIDMRFASVNVGSNTHISFNQNEMGSTIYLLNGFAEITNLAGESTVLAPGQKITVSRLDANKEDIDLSLLKENIDDYFKQSDWFIKNNGSIYIYSETDEDEESSTGTVLPVSFSGDNLISFSNLFDESNVSSSKIDISGNYMDEEITKILLNDVEATINKTSKTFTFEGVSISNRENDLVFKVYDDANDLLSKFVYTIYYDGATISNNNSAFKVQTFDVDGSQFTFTSIKDGVLKNLNGKTIYTTSGDFLTIYGNVLAEGIANVSVNGYTLKSFNGTSWRYHPSVINNNLSIGTNVYEVKYFNTGGDIVYTNYFTIIKKEQIVETNVTEKETEKVSGEATVN